MSKSSSPSLGSPDGDDGLTLDKDAKLNRLLHTALEVLVHILLPLPDDLAELGLGLGVVEGVHSTRQVGVSGGGGGSGNHT
jgi:hypothetical protein